MTAKNEQRVLSIEEFFKIATLEQKELLSDLYDNIEKEIQMTKKINNIYGSIGQGICSTDHSVTVCESEDDANVISLRLKIELKEVRKNIGVLLKKAVDKFEMGNVGIIQRQYDNYVT